MADFSVVFPILNGFALAKMYLHPSILNFRQSVLLGIFQEMFDKQIQLEPTHFVG